MPSEVERPDLRALFPRRGQVKRVGVTALHRLVADCFPLQLDANCLIPAECNCAGPIRGRPCWFPNIPPVDTRQVQRQSSRFVKKKPAKVEETATPYAAKKPAPAAAPVSKPGSTSGVRYMDDATFNKAADKVFKTHAELFRKLAQ